MGDNSEQDNSDSIQHHFLKHKDDIYDQIKSLDIVHKNLYKMDKKTMNVLFNQMHHRMKTYDDSVALWQPKYEELNSYNKEFYRKFQNTKKIKLMSDKKKAMEKGEFLLDNALAVSEMKSIKGLLYTYKDKGYKIPNLDYNQRNLFSSTPLLTDQNGMTNYYILKHDATNEKVDSEKEKHMMYLKNMRTMLKNRNIVLRDYNEKIEEVDPKVEEEIKLRNMRKLIKESNEIKTYNRNINRLIKQEAKETGISHTKSLSFGAGKSILFQFNQKEGKNKTDTLNLKVDNDVDIKHDAKSSTKLDEIITIEEYDFKKEKKENTDKVKTKISNKPPLPIGKTKTFKNNNIQKINTLSNLIHFKSSTDINKVLLKEKTIPINLFTENKTDRNKVLKLSPETIEESYNNTESLKSERMDKTEPNKILTPKSPIANTKGHLGLVGKAKSSKITNHMLESSNKRKSLCLFSPDMHKKFKLDLKKIIITNNNLGQTPEMSSSNRFTDDRDKDKESINVTYMKRKYTRNNTLSNGKKKRGSHLVLSPKGEFSPISRNTRKTFPLQVTFSTISNMAGGTGGNETCSTFFDRQNISTIGHCKTLSVTKNFNKNNKYASPIRAGQSPIRDENKNKRILDLLNREGFDGMSKGLSVKLLYSVSKTKDEKTFEKYIKAYYEKYYHEKITPEVLDNMIKQKWDLKHMINYAKDIKRKVANKKMAETWRGNALRHNKYEFFQKNINKVEKIDNKLMKLPYDILNEATKMKD